MKLPNKRHIGSRAFVTYLEVVPISEVTIKLSSIPLIDRSNSYLSLINIITIRVLYLILVHLLSALVNPFQGCICVDTQVSYYSLL